MKDEPQLNQAAKIEVTPLSPTAVGVGCVLGGFVFLIGVWMIYRQWQQRNAKPTRSENASEPTAQATTHALSYFERGRIWRTPTAIIMMAIGALIIFGVFIDPQVEWRRFIIVWTSIGFAVFALLCMAGFDLLVTRTRFWKAQRIDLQERRDTLARDVAELRARKAASDAPRESEPRGPSSNGHHNGFLNGKH